LEEGRGEAYTALLDRSVEKKGKEEGEVGCGHFGAFKEEERRKKRKRRKRGKMN